VEIISIRSSTRKVKGEVILPTSKSISNRLLVLQLLYQSPKKIIHLSNAEDTQVLLVAIHTIMQSDGEETTIDIGACGTAMRFLTSALAVRPGTWLLQGDGRMHQRPIGALVHALTGAGASIAYTYTEGCAPLRIEGKLLGADTMSIDGSMSSQYISSLMMIAPQLSQQCTLQLQGAPTSKPYIEMTASLMQQLGFVVVLDHDMIHIAQPKPLPHTPIMVVEGDWSAASYWYALAALAEEVDLFLAGLHQNSLQGDCCVADIYTQFGVHTHFMEGGVRITKTPEATCVTSFTYDFKNCPDLVQTVAVTCAVLNIAAHLTGTSSLQHKETSRADALVHELNKLFAAIASTNQAEIVIKKSTHRPIVFKDPIIHTYHDHRMAMAFAQLALLAPITVENPRVVRKSYPQFWNQLKEQHFNLQYLTNE
jgi:3-phosphoshikimate 1-carboxyvinyltransferase